MGAMTLEADVFRFLENLEVHFVTELAREIPGNLLDHD